MLYKQAKIFQKYVFAGGKIISNLSNHFFQLIESRHFLSYRYQITKKRDKDREVRWLEFYYPTSKVSSASFLTFSTSSFAVFVFFSPSLASFHFLASPPILFVPRGPSVGGCVRCERWKRITTNALLIPSILASGSVIRLYNPGLIMANQCSDPELCLHAGF